ncbi:hypothetical protein BYT27DRAFT_7128667 [Phlegmacium glaucopus]|nr:hypothetical protein BYT27DRAFT_7128667 [Phlegmacium glaucopus]
MHTEAQIVAANSQLAKKTALMGVLATQYDRSMQDLEATRNELQQVRAEYAKLMASVDDVGLVYMNGTLHFNDNTAKIVSDFREGARMQDMAISHMNPDTAPVPPDHNVEAPSKTIKPSDFFAFLSDVMEKGQRYAHGLKMHQQRRSASLSEGNTSTNDAALQDAELEQDSSHVGPGISPTYSPSLSENKFPK